MAFLREQATADTYSSSEQGIYKYIIYITDMGVKNVFNSGKMHVHLPVLKRKTRSTLRYITRNCTADNVAYHKHRVASQRPVCVEARWEKHKGTYM